MCLVWVYCFLFLCFNTPLLDIPSLKPNLLSFLFVHVVVLFWLLLCLKRHFFLFKQWFPNCQTLLFLRGLTKEWFSKRVVLADVPPERKPERGYIQMFPRNENRNEGTFAKTTLFRNRPFVSSRLFLVVARFEPCEASLSQSTLKLGFSTMFGYTPQTETQIPVICLPCCLLLFGFAQAV